MSVLRTAAKLLTRDEARRIGVNIVVRKDGLRPSGADAPTIDSRSAVSPPIRFGSAPVSDSPWHEKRTGGRTAARGFAIPSRFPAAVVRRGARGLLHRQGSRPRAARL
jgi:hypothetical protein